MCTRRTLSWARLRNAGRDLLNCLPGLGIASGSYCAGLNQRPEFGAGIGMNCVVQTSLDLPCSLCPCANDRCATLGSSAKHWQSKDHTATCSRPSSLHCQGSSLFMPVDSSGRGFPVVSVFLAYLSPYATEQLKRFGEYSTRHETEPPPSRTRSATARACMVRRLVLRRDGGNRLTSGH